MLIPLSILTTEPANAEEAQSMNKRWEDAIALFSKGYKAIIISLDKIKIESPEGKEYIVDTTELTCTCPFFSGRSVIHQPGYCKHLFAWLYWSEYMEYSTNKGVVEWGSSKLGKTGP